MTFFCWIFRLCLFTTRHHITLYCKVYGLICYFHCQTHNLRKKWEFYDIWKLTYKIVIFHVFQKGLRYIPKKEVKSIKILLKNVSMHLNHILDQNMRWFINNIVEIKVKFIFLHFRPFPAVSTPFKIIRVLKRVKKC